MNILKFLNIFGLFRNVMNIFTNITSFNPNSILIKLGIWAAILLLIGGSGFLTYSYFKTKASQDLATAISYAHSQGVAEAQRDVIDKTNIQLAQDAQIISQLSADTNSKLEQIRVASENERQAIETHVISQQGTVIISKDSVIQSLPVEEKWSNTLNNSIFNTIQGETQ